MAASMGRLLVAVERPLGRGGGGGRLVCLGLEALLSPVKLCASATIIPVRTKKRHYVPPRKQDSSADQEKLARAAGLVIRQQYIERPINISCTAGIFDPYVPPEGDARMSTLTKAGLKQRMEQAKQSAASQLAIRKVKEYDSEFSTKDFASKAQDIYINAHQCLVDFDKVKLHKLVTERCYPDMVRGNRFKTIRWKFLQSLEAPKIVHIRCPDMVSKGNVYGQVTVRFHTQQTLAIYDRFGRLMYGNEDLPKDVLEYVVFERHLVNPYGSWRMHGKIVPAWAPPKDAIIKTIMIPGPKLQPWEEFEAKNIEVPKAESIQWSK
ncbi:39S ribosomal protein L45, mitochondrial [Pristis pectinata]|uniref:39S ribosomal protein L45, mitochondrial n=1 Tax=Pristis pectinata TaxID=685728 RepID=UPI00223D6579|nr:39S ribosomal protein L45, mitochondrial [Pristis pectinata]